MGLRRNLYGLLLASPAGLGLGCWASAPARSNRPDGTLPASVPDSTGTRSQKPDAPVVLALPPTTLADGEVSVRAAAYVNNMPIFDSEVREALVLRMRELEGLSESEREQKLKDLRAQELEKLIEREVVLTEAYRKLSKMPGKVMEDLQREAGKEFQRRLKELKEAYKLKGDDQVKTFFQQQGMSLTNFRRSVERSFIAMEYMRNVIFPKVQHIPLSEVKAFYDTHQAEFTEKEHVKWLDIFIDAEKFANRTEARDYAGKATLQLAAGADFVGTAKKLQQAGYNLLPSEAGIGEHPGEIKPQQLEAAVFALKLGQVGGPIEVPGGFHIVKLTEHARAGLREFNADTQKEIRERLLGLLSNKEYRRLIEEMKAGTFIQRLE
jgi:peptidyl-prolyl cis-trans isomerase SurA